MEDYMDIEPIFEIYRYDSQYCGLSSLVYIWHRVLGIDFKTILVAIQACASVLGMWLEPVCYLTPEP